MADISLWQQSLETPQHLVDPNRLVTSLYECCLQLFLCFVKRPVPGLESSIQRRLRTQAQKFKLWGFSFNTREGEIDQRLVGADGLRNALLPILSGMGETLVTLARRLNGTEKLADTFSQFNLLRAQVSEVTSQSCPDNDDTFPQISLDELSSLESGDSSVDEMAEFEDLVRDVQSYNSCLFGLSSALEDPAEKAIPDFDASLSLESSSQELLNVSAWPYITNIIETYPSIDRAFARRLGEANEVRYTRLQARRDHAQAGPSDIDSDAASDSDSEEVLQGNQSLQSQTHVSSGFTSPSTRLSSIFDSASFNPAKKPKARAAASVTTFASIVLEENSQKRSRGIPKMPEDQPWGTPFNCTVCGDYLENVWSSVQWVRHVYQDLQPYICIFADCNLGIQTFVSGREWRNHDLTEHRGKQPEDLNQASQEICPFCQTLVAGPRSQFMSHVGKHMQEISHAAIPMSAMTTDDGDLELSDEDDDTIHDSLAPAQVAEPESVFIVPPGFRSNSIFVGREREMEQLNKLLFDERPRDWDGTVPVLLHGMPGVGKSQIAREFTFRNRDKFKGGVFWIPAQSKELISHHLQKLMQKLANQGGSGEPIQSVNIWLGKRQNWLLVFDGLPVEDRDMMELSNIAPESKDSRIIYIARSSRVSALHWPITLKIEPLTQEASQRLLFRELNLAKTNERQREKATELTESVGRLPLAIQAIARRLADTHQSLEEFELSVSHLSLGATYQNILHDLLRAGHTEAWNLLHILCWFAPTLPVEMLVFGLKVLEDINVKASEDGQAPNINITFAQLIRYGLIERNHPEDAMDEGSNLESRVTPELADAIEMHTVIQSFCCDSLNASNLVAEWLARAIQIFCYSYRRADNDMELPYPTVGPRVDDYIQYLMHGRKLWKHCQSYSTKDRPLGYFGKFLEPVLASIKQKIQNLQISIAEAQQSRLDPQRNSAPIFEGTSQSDSDPDLASDGLMSHIETKVSLPRHHPGLLSYGTGAATQVSSQSGDDQAKAKEVQQDTKNSLQAQPEISRYGLTQVYSPVGGALVDIVFVHGLNGDPHGTWTAEKSNIFWPAQLLPSVIEEEKARILTYGYEADMSSFTDAKSKDSLANHAEHLIAQLVANRRLRKANERPLIFVAHSLGGLLVKQALVYSAEISGILREYLGSILISTYGILFLGTPQSSNMDTLGPSLERIFTTAFPKKLVESQPQLMDAFKQNSETLQEINHRFIQLMDRFRIYYFHEGSPTNLKGTRQYVVDEYSASPNVQDIERAPIYADHSHMCKFEDDSAPGFDLVAEGIQRYAGDAPKTIAERWKVKKEVMLRKSEQERSILLPSSPGDDI